MRAAWPVIAAWVLLGASPTLAQEPNPATHIQQMNPTPDARQATEARQINPSAAPLLAPVESVAPDRTIDGSAKRIPTPPALDQLSTERPTAQAGIQLAIEAANAGPAPSPTDRASGRVTTVARPDGPDRCDPQSARRLSVVCDRVIEARASEFSSPDFQPLSAEQRLLATQRQERLAATDVGSAARRLANGELDDSNAALAVASITLGPLVDDEKQDPEAVGSSAAIDAIVAGITTLVTGAPPIP